MGTLANNGSNSRLDACLYDKECISHWTPEIYNDLVKHSRRKLFVKKNQFTPTENEINWITETLEHKGLNKFWGVLIINLLSANPTKWLNTFSCVWIIFDHSVELGAWRVNLIIGQHIKCSFCELSEETRTTQKRKRTH